MINFAHDSILFRLCGCLLFCIIFVCCTTFFNLGLTLNIEIDSLITGKTFGFLGLFLDTNLSEFPLLVFSLAVLNSSCGIAFAF